MRGIELDRFVYEFVVGFCQKHDGNGPVLREIADAIDNERLRLATEDRKPLEVSVGIKTVERVLFSLEKGGLITIARNGDTRRIAGRISVEGATWYPPQDMEARWQHYLAILKLK